MSESPKPPPSSDAKPPHPELAAVLGEAVGMGADGKPDLAALVLPLLRSGAGPALIGSLFGGPARRTEPAAGPVAAAADPHPVDDQPAGHGGASSPLAAIIPPTSPGTRTMPASIDPGALLNTLLGKHPPPR